MRGCERNLPVRRIQIAGPWCRHVLASHDCLGPGMPAHCEPDQLPQAAEAAPPQPRWLRPAAPAHPTERVAFGLSRSLHRPPPPRAAGCPIRGRTPRVVPGTTSGSADSCCSLCGIMHKLCHTLRGWQGNNDLLFRQSMGEGGMQVEMALPDKRGRQAAVQVFGAATTVARPFRPESVGALTLSAL